jgi:hypothetical protein
MKLKLFNKACVNSKEVEQLKEAISTRDNEIASLRRRVTTITNDKNKFENGYNKCDSVIKNEQNMWERAPSTIADLEKRQSCDEIMKLLKREIINSYAKRLERRRSDYIITNGGNLVTTKGGQIADTPNALIYTQSIQTPANYQTPTNVLIPTNTQSQTNVVLPEVLSEPFDAGNQSGAEVEIPNPNNTVNDIDIIGINYGRPINIDNRDSISNLTTYNIKLKSPYGTRIIYKTGNLLKDTLDKLFCGNYLTTFLVLLLLFICICLVIGLIILINKYHNIKQLIQS